MSFWNTSTGENAATGAKTEYEVATDIELIPDGSTVAAFIKEAKWDEGREEDGYPNFIKIQWMVEKPEELARRVVFQKLWVKDPDPNAKDSAKADAKRDKALATLATIDANAGGKLASNGGEPNDDQLALALQNKEMVISVKVWEMGDAKGNWVSAIRPKGTELKVPETKEAKGGNTAKDIDDDIPF